MNISRSGGLMAATGFGIRSAFSWRLILLWVVVLAIPALLVALPQWQLLAPHIANSVHADSWSSGLNVPVIADLLMALARDGGSPLPNMGLAVIVTLLLSPFLNGMLVAQLGHSNMLGFQGLLQGGIEEYGRMFRLLLVALIPMGIAFAISGGLTSMAADHAEAAVFSSDADLAGNVAMIVGALVLLFAHASVEAGRAHFVIDGRLRSAFKAWWRGFRMLLRRPVATLGVYLLLTLVSLLIALALIVLRLNISVAGIGGFILGLLVTQLVVASLAWGRIARMGGLASLAQSSQRSSMR